jgi:hypothetical protein
LEHDKTHICEPATISQRALYRRVLEAKGR